jgi:ferredoxin
MAQRINQRSCTQCGACVEECPNGGIEEVDGTFIILPSLCSECYGFHEAPRCVDVCPADAIQDDPAFISDDLTNAYRAMEQHTGRFPRD